MNLLFLVDNDKSYTYVELIKSLNTSFSYYPHYRTSVLYEYFVNLIKALICDQPLVLLDSDLNSLEIEGVNEQVINQAVDINFPRIISMDDIIRRIQHSKSEITIFTSGTTGQPKKVVHSVSSLTRAVRTGDKYSSQVWAYAYNPTHMAGLQVFFQAFENVNTLVNVFNATRTEVYERIDSYGITHISATPTFYRLLLPAEKVYKEVQRITLGGEKSDSHLYDSIKKIFPNAKINNVYASTEAGSLFAAKDDCFQIPFHLLNMFKVENDELLIHKSLLGYSASFHFKDDYYCSGDLIEWVDEKNGLFRFKSRKNELVNVGGYKVNPSEVENILLRIEGIKQVLVYGRANSVLGSVLCADIQLKEGVILTDIDIKKILKQQLQDFKVPRQIRFVESISLTRTGKLKRS